MSLSQENEPRVLKQVSGQTHRTQEGQALYAAYMYLLSIILKWIQDLSPASHEIFPVPLSELTATSFLDSLDSHLIPVLG